jgi:hypothetical protein
VDEALCFGWIDGLRKGIDAESYKIRFTPRRPASNWSAINIRRMKELMRERRVRPAGMKAFQKRPIQLQRTKHILGGFLSRVRGKNMLIVPATLPGQRWEIGAKQIFQERIEICSA